MVANVTIDDNLLAGGGYTIYGGQGSKGQPSHIVITKNRISTRFFRRGGQWGPAAYFSTHAAGDVWSGNVWDGTGRRFRHHEDVHAPPRAPSGPDLARQANGRRIYSCARRALSAISSS